MLRALDQYDLPTIWEAMQAAYAADGNKPPADPEIGRFLRRRFLANSPACLRAIARQLLETPDRVGELAGTGVPMLVAHGVDDDAWPPELQAEMAERLGAHRVAIPGAAHSPAAEQPEQTAAALTGFWASAERAG
jgi:pimeloyl-ACP methyl ester carboxylesterase